MNFVQTAEFNWLLCEKKKKKKKKNLLRSHMGDETETLQKCSYYEPLQNRPFLLPLYFHYYGNLKFPLTYYGKSENLPLLLSHCRYFEKSFTEMFLQ